MANSVDPDQTAPIGAVCSGSPLFASILNVSGMLGNYLQQTTSADDIFRCIFFLALQGLRYGLGREGGGGRGVERVLSKIYQKFRSRFKLMLYNTVKNFKSCHDVPESST